MSQSLRTGPGPMPPADTPVTLAQILSAVRRRWLWVAVPTVLGLMGSAAFVTVAKPRYTAESKLILEARDGFYTRPDKERASDPLIDDQAVASQVQVIMSRDLAREAIQRLGLVGNPDFDPASAEPGLGRRVLAMLGVAKALPEGRPEDRVLEKYYDNLSVYAVGKSRIVSVEFRSGEAELSARAANIVAELYLDRQEAAKKDTARSASAWLGTSIESLRARVAEAEAKVEVYRSRSGLLMGSANSTVPAQHLSDLNSQLAAARTSQADAQAKAALIRDLIRGGRLFEIPDVANNELIRRLIEQRVSLRAQLALESRTLMPAHPRIKELNAQLGDLEGQIRGAAERTVRTLENDARIAGARLESLQAAVDVQKKVVAGANESEVQLRALEREARAQREQLESYLVRYREAVARDAEHAAPADARIVSRAIAPQTPSFPKKVPTIVLTVLAMLLLSIGAIVARELLTMPPGARPRTDDASAEPETESAPDPLPPSPPPSPGPKPGMAGGALSALVDRLGRAQPQGRGRRVLVTGLESPWRARRLAMDLGRAVATGGQAILVRLDEPGPAKGPGFAELVCGDATFLDVIAREPRSTLHLVEAGSVEGLSLAEEEDGIEIALAAFDQTYDWVVVLCHKPDASLVELLAGRVDGVVIASGEEPTSERLVDLYELAKGAGARDVIVAREPAQAQAAAA
ncbi:GumC family protein [Salinarimonas soli]|uniref:Lipopolysaccharide biosynthesis protein n=1 Tax=Salinarimonas soli TaxID=1638099 RepID=A0A5B2V7E7_9HYPH|nr:GumC family protein [Salinarimonas soli]KAA2234726.1 lipopolysaccharide biosynthesis protein [Salinarimonas soli]